MNPHNQPFKLNPTVVAALSGGLLVSLATLALAGGPPPQSGRPAAQPDTTQPASPAPATAAPATTTQPVQAAPATTTPASPQPSPSPASQTNAAPKFPLPSARIAASNGKVTVKLVNTTNALINYQVVGDTQQRTLGEQSQVQLQSLTIPTNITYQRQDGGLLLVRPQATATPGLLQVTFSVTNDLNVDTKSLNIQDNGSVFLQ
ncbi:MAG: hypothetical protein ACM37W_14720 [Actinomycetota bacterium]